MKPFFTALVLACGCVGQMGVEPVTPIDTLYVLPFSIDAAPGDQAQLSAQRYQGGTATDFTKKVVWRSSDPAVATVSASGRVTANKPGKAVVTGAAEGVSASAEIIVGSPGFQVMPQALELALTSLEDGGVDAQVEQLHARIWSADVATDVTAQTLWGSSDVDVASVGDGGVVVAVGAGHATLTGVFQGTTATVEVSVTEVLPE